MSVSIVEFDGSKENPKLPNTPRSLEAMKRLGISNEELKPINLKDVENLLGNKLDANAKQKAFEKFKLRREGKIQRIKELWNEINVEFKQNPELDPNNKSRSMSRSLTHNKTLNSELIQREKQNLEKVKERKLKEIEKMIDQEMKTQELKELNEKKLQIEREKEIKREKMVELKRKEVYFEVYKRLKRKRTKWKRKESKEKQESKN